MPVCPSFEWRGPSASRRPAVPLPAGFRPPPTAAAASTPRPRPAGYPTLPNTSNVWNFTAAFSRASIPASAFAVPPGCTSMCATSQESYATRLQRRFDAGVGGLTRARP